LLRAFGQRASATPSSVLSVGDHLSDAFRLPSHHGVRGQSGVSSAGTAWANLVIYYLNLCLAGTDAIAMSKRSVPASIKGALKVSYKGTPAAALESDIDAIVIYAPGAGANPPAKSTKFAAMREFSAFADTHFANLSVVLFQTKTNWNDTAQIPMLWNMVYDLAYKGKMPRNGFSIGSGQWHLNALKSFAYAFATVPTQSDLSKFKPNSTPVARVAGCTGGAYWGRPSKLGVIQSMTEFFVNFYNSSQQQFPKPSQIGVGYAHEINASPRAGNVDIKAFDLLT
jgi:hypothetical protein